HLCDRMEVELIGTVHGPRRGVPGEHGHGEHDDFLNPSCPTEVPAQNRCAHDPYQIRKIDATLYMNPPPRLHVFGERARCFDIFLHKNVLIENVEHEEQASDCKCPLWNQGESPVERHAAQETKEQ